jgi:hypothetical protein
MAKPRTIESLQVKKAEVEWAVKAYEAKLNQSCKGPAVVIDGKAAAIGQGWRITLSPKPSAESVRDWRGARPWVALDPQGLP